MLHVCAERFAGDSIDRPLFHIQYEFAIYARTVVSDIDSACAETCSAAGNKLRLDTCDAMNIHPFSPFRQRN